MLTVRSVHKNPLRAAGLVAILAMLAVIGTGCGSPFGSGGEGSIAEDFDLGGPQETAQLTVGSKAFTEQEVLGHITIQALEAAGADVEDRTGLGGTEAVRRALISGEIDIYWEYTGTGWLIHLAKTGTPSDNQELYEALAESDFESNSIEWLEPAPASNVYRIAVREEAYEELGVETISDFEQLIEESPQEATLCVGSEFRNRADALPGLEEAYGFEVPDENLVELPDSTVYGAVDSGERCNFGSVFETSGRIPALDLQLIEDDKDFFPAYNPSPTVRKEVLEKYPQLADIFAPISEELDTETMRQLNAAVSVEGRNPREVAEQWLRENGFTG